MSTKEIGAIHSPPPELPPSPLMPDPMGWGCRQATEVPLPHPDFQECLGRNLALHSWELGLQSGSTPFTPLMRAQVESPCQVGHGQHHPCFFPHLASLRQAAPPMLGGTVRATDTCPRPLASQSSGEAGLQSKIKRTWVPWISIPPRHKHRDTCDFQITILTLH